jgi:hypothetical protein
VGIALTRALNDVVFLVLFSANDFTSGYDGRAIRSGF